MEKLLSWFGMGKAENTYLIVGLGNPGKEFRNNRHNVGFMVIDEFAKRHGVEFRRVRQEALVEKSAIYGLDVVLAKPRTFMNRSGVSVAALARFYKLPQEQILIAFDDVDLDFGRVRLKPEGGSSGQKGMKSVIEKLGTKEFPRLRIGIGRPPGKMKTPSYVLQDFSKSEQKELPFLLDRAASAIDAFLTEGIEMAMNSVNQKLDE